MIVHHVYRLGWLHRQSKRMRAGVDEQKFCFSELLDSQLVFLFPIRVFLRYLGEEN